MSFPFTLPETPEHDGELPDAADAVIVGGGVIGVCAALALAEDGLRVVLCEKGRVAAEQSSRNWGWVRVQGRDPAEIPVALEAQRLWQEFDTACDGRLGLRRVGVTYLGETEAEVARFSSWLASASPFGVSSRLLDREGVARLLPGASTRWAGGLHTPTDMVAEPWVAVPELARLAAARGVTIRERCAVRTLRTEAGAVTGVVTERGPIRTERVLVAGGAWSSLFLRRHGVSIPQLSVRATALETGPLPQVTGTAGVDSRLAFRPRGDGGYTLAPSTASEFYVGPDALRAARKYWRVLRETGFDIRLHPAAPAGFPDAWGTPRHWGDADETPFERMRILTPPPNLGKAHSACAAFAESFPEAGPVTPRTAWAGMIDTMPDVVPVVDRVAPVPGLTVATGMSGHGFGIGPAFGRIAAALMQDRDPGHALTRFRFDRFSDGSPMRPGPGF